MPQFRINIPNEKRRTYHLVNVLILLINLILFGLVAISSQDKLSFVAYFAVLLNAIAIGWHYKYGKKRPSTRLPFFFILLNAICWLTIQNWLAGFLMILLAILEFVINKKLEINFDDEGINYPSFPAKKFRWEEVEQALIKDGILTIDLKDNRLMQFNLSPEDLKTVNTGEFNEFCLSKTR